MVDVDLARGRGCDTTALVQVGEHDTTHEAPAGPGGIWPETFCSRPVAHGLDRAVGDRCDRCRKAAATYRGEAGDEPPVRVARAKARATHDGATASEVEEAGRAAAQAPDHSSDETKTTGD